MRTLLAIVGLWAVCLCALAGNSLQEIQARGRIVVSVKNVGNEDHAKHKDPAHFEKRGFEIDLARAIAKQAVGDPNDIEYKMMRKPLRLTAVANGDVDLAISMVHVTPNAKEIVDFSVPYYEGGVAVMERDTASTASLADLSDKRLGLIARNDSNTADILADLPNGAKPSETQKFASFDQAATAIRKGQVDALLSESANVKVYVDKHGDGLRASPQLTHDQVAVAVQKGNAALLKVVNHTIEILRSSGELASLLDASHIAQ